MRKVRQKANSIQMNKSKTYPLPNRATDGFARGVVFCLMERGGAPLFSMKFFVNPYKSLTFWKKYYIINTISIYAFLRGFGCEKPYRTLALNERNCGIISVYIEQ